MAPYIAAHLRELDSEVVSFSRSAGDNFQKFSLLAEPRMLADFDAVLHLGWSTVPLTAEERPGTEQKSDLPQLQDLLNACAAVRRPPHLVFFSTAAVYGNTTAQATEETPCAPLGGYSRGKLLAEEIIRNACSRHRTLRCGILRISNVFGWNTNSTKPQGIISRICRAIHEDASISLWGDGENTKDYLFLADFLDAVQAVVTCGLTGTFNVASEKSLSVNDIIALVESLVGKKLTIAHRPAFAWDVQESHISARKLRTATGWRPRHDPAEAIQQLTEAELKWV